MGLLERLRHWLIRRISFERARKEEKRHIVSIEELKKEDDALKKEEAKLKELITK